MSRRPRSGMLLALVGSAALLAGMAGPLGIASEAGASSRVQPASVSSSAWAVMGTIGGQGITTPPYGTAIDLTDDTVYLSVDRSGLFYIGAIAAGTTSGAFDDSVVMPAINNFLAVDSDDDTVYATPVSQAALNGVLWEVNGRTLTIDDSSLPFGSTGLGAGRYLTQPAVNSADDSVYLGRNGNTPQIAVVSPTGVRQITVAGGGYSSANNFAVNQLDDTVYAAWLFDTKVSGFAGAASSPTFANRTVSYPYGLAVNSPDDSVYAIGPTAGPGPSTIYEFAGADFSSARSVTLPSVGNRVVKFLALSASGAYLVASEGNQSSGAQVYVINPVTMTVDDTVSTGTAPSEGGVQVTSSGLIYAPVYTGFKVIAQISGPNGNWSGSAGDTITASLTPTPSVVNGRAITVDDSTVTSVSVGDDTTAFALAGNQLSVTIPPGSGTVSVTAALNGGNSVSLGSFTYASAPPPTPVTYPPSAPLNAAATAGDASAAVTWSAPAWSGSFPVTNYQVTPSPGGKSCLVTAPTTSCTIDGLANGTAYTFTVRALNGAGWSPESTPSAPVTPDAPATPTIVITGSRGTGEGRIGRVLVDGATTDLAGALVQARVHLAGEVDYYKGSTRRVSDDETFTWQRLTKKKVYVYFTAQDGTVRSNRLIISP